MRCELYFKIDDTIFPWLNCTKKESCSISLMSNFISSDEIELKNLHVNTFTKFKPVSNSAADKISVPLPYVLRINIDGQRKKLPYDCDCKSLCVETSSASDSVEVLFLPFPCGNALCSPFHHYSIANPTLTPSLSLTRMALPEFKNSTAGGLWQSKMFSRLNLKVKCRRIRFKNH